MKSWTIDEYMEDVYSQLECNASDDFKSKHIVYNYTPEEVDINADYFEACFMGHMSAYKALLFFHDYLKANDTQKSIFREHVMSLSMRDIKDDEE